MSGEGDALSLVHHLTGRGLSFLEPGHQARIVEAYSTFKDDSGFARVVTNEEALRTGGDLSITRYVGEREEGVASTRSGLARVLIAHEEQTIIFQRQMESLADALSAIVRRTRDGH